MLELGHENVASNSSESQDLIGALNNHSHP